MLDTLLLGFILSINVSLVAFSYGLAMKRWDFPSTFKLLFTMGFFQFLMPLLGYFFLSSTNLLGTYAKQFDHWIVFIIFLLLGEKVVKDSFSQEDNKDITPLSLIILLTIGIATSLDALAGGVMIFAQNTSVWLDTALIGGIAFMLVYISYALSRFFSRHPSFWLNLVGGGLLIVLGFKIFFEHTLILGEGFQP